MANSTTLMRTRPSYGTHGRTLPVSSFRENRYQPSAHRRPDDLRQGADVAHFPEASLSGYTGVDFASFDGFDWDALRTATRGIMSLARDLRLWVVLGSAHELTAGKPHNCSYIIDAGGQLVDRYDKMFCAGDSGETSGDLLHYAAGSHFSVFTVNGVRCGVLICHDYRYPELYREYKKRGVQVGFHAHSARDIDAALGAAEAGLRAVAGMG